MYNNKKGPDAELLKRFEEPSWNNPVVRYLSADGSDVLDRIDRIWTVEGTARRMVAALQAADRKVPSYLEMVAGRTDKAQGLETAEFAMHCYWEGEAKLATIPGVQQTRSGWRGKLEVVQVQYDPSQVGYGRLLASAQKFECASKVYAHTERQLQAAKQAVGEDAVDVRKDQLMKDAKLADQKYYLRNSDLRHLPLTETQAGKINGAMYTKQDFRVMLSPRQQKLLVRIRALKKRDPDALSEFVWPDDDSKLAEFTKQLVDALN